MADIPNEAVIMYNEKLLEHDQLTAGKEGGRLSSIIKQLQVNNLWDGIADFP